MKFLAAVAIFATVALCAANDKPRNDKEKKELSHQHLEEIKKEVHSVEAPKAKEEHKVDLKEVHKKATRPLMIQEVIRVREKIVVDSKNHPKAFAADIVKAIYKIEDGKRKRLSLSRFFIRPRAIPAVHQSVQQHHLPQHAQEDIDVMGFLGVLGFVVGFGAIAYLIAAFLDRKDKKKKEMADYAKLLKVPTAEHMANNAPMAPSSRA